MARACASIPVRIEWLNGAVTDERFAAARMLSTGCSSCERQTPQKLSQDCRPLD
jgi:hypothetical protein